MLVGFEGTVDSKGGKAELTGVPMYNVKCQGKWKGRQRRSRKPQDKDGCSDIAKINAHTTRKADRKDEQPHKRKQYSRQRNRDNDIIQRQALMLELILNANLTRSIVPRRRPAVNYTQPVFISITSTLSKPIQEEGKREEKLTRQRHITLIRPHIPPLQHRQTLSNRETLRTILQRNHLLLVRRPAKLRDVRVLLVLHPVPQCIGRGRGKEETDTAERGVGDIEVHVAFEFHRLDAAVAEEGEGEGFADDDVDAITMSEYKASNTRRKIVVPLRLDLRDTPPNIRRSALNARSRVRSLNRRCRRRAHLLPMSRQERLTSQFPTERIEQLGLLRFLTSQFHPAAALERRLAQSRWGRGRRGGGTFWGVEALGNGRVA